MSLMQDSGRLGVEEKKNYFDVAIKILECRGLSTQIKHVSTQICVQVGEDKKYSKVIRHTTTPFFDEYFVFTKYLTLSEFLGTLIVISALHIRKGIRIKKLIGSITLDVATIWNQPERGLKKWFALSLPSDRSVQRRAFAECDLKIAANSEYKEFISLQSFETSEIIGSKRARYKVTVYKCAGLDIQPTKLIDQGISVKVWYAGKREGTTIKKPNESIDWNEQISFIELFPPMRQSLTIELCMGQKVLAVRTFSLIEFFKIFQGGFLNMFGPTFIHMYAERNSYQGSLLMSLESETLGQLREFEHANGTTLSLVEPISQIKYGIKKKFVCFGIIFELVVSKPNCGKEDIYLSLDMGSSKNVETEKFLGQSTDKFIYVNFGKRKPCFAITCEWPDCCHRLYNANVLASLTRDLRKKLDESNKMMAKGCEVEARNSLLSACHTFRENEKRILQLLSRGITELDAKRTMFLRKQLTLMAALFNLDINLQNVGDLCKFFFSVYSEFIEEMQDSLPLLLITLRQSKNVIGSCVVHPEEIIYSEVNEKRGIKSAKLNNLLFKDENGEIVAETDIWLWLGKTDNTKKCHGLFPAGYELFCLPKTNVLQLPYILRYNNVYTYTAICHVHSAYIDEKAATEGDCDSFVNVIFFNRSKQTITAKRTLAPAWKETLILLNIKLHLPPKYLAEHPPMFILELWNATTTPAKLIGSGVATSGVSLQPATNVTDFPLKWRTVKHGCEILAACELYPVDSDSGHEEFSHHRQCSVIPRFLEPKTIPYRLEIIFWGMRPSVARPVKDLVQPQVSIELSTASLGSGIIARASQTFNFNHDSRVTSLKLPQNRLLSPPLIMKIISNMKYLAMVSEKNIYRYEYKLPAKSQWDHLYSRIASGERTSATGSQVASFQVAYPDLIPPSELTDNCRSSFGTIFKMSSRRFKSMIDDFSDLSKFFHSNTSGDEYPSDSDDELEQDWWDRYWNTNMMIYDNSLEEQEDFSGFTDVLTTFPIKKANTRSGKSHEIGKLKAIISLYKWPVDHPVVTMQGQDPEMGILKLSQLSSRVNLLVRVYCVKATNLYPSDMNGKSDPYIEIATQSRKVSDKLNKKIAELNPIFGNYHEIAATLPIDSMLAVRVMDWDAYSKDDIIGETIIDIENRFYSRHRATCGLPETYSTTGPNTWRDIETPKEILERLCNAYNLPLPQYFDKSVIIGSKVFVINKSASDREENQQRLALAALNHWEQMPIVGRPLVKEHVETRLLFKENCPGLVRGKLTMWVDMFDTSLGNIPPPFEIAPRAAQAFELRVNILNTAKVPLLDENKDGNKRSSDITVRGWLGNPKQVQKTDIHYNSYTGEGHFNWRFVFPFSYLRKEDKMVFYEKNLFDVGKTEVKVPAVLHLEVYDSEGLLEDSFIGGMMLELCHMPRGAPSVESCNPEKIYNTRNFIDLFKVENIKGWWPFLINKTIMRDTGFLEAEFFLITAEEARKYPVGLGRSPPDPLPMPDRGRHRKTPWHVFEEIINKYDCNFYWGVSINLLIVLSVLVLLGVLIYTLSGTFEKLKPWLEQIF